MTQDAARELAELILSMAFTTAKGQHARDLARKILGVPDIYNGPDLVAITTNGTTRFIPRGEPVFLLRAQDIYAAETVRHWASKVDTPDISSGSKIATSAYEHADTMDAWPIKKTPDLYVDKDR